MEELITFLIPAILAGVLIRLLLIPMKLIWKLALNAGFGFICLWLLNTIGAFTGIYLPINLVTSLTAGILGLPGIALVALLTIL